VLAALCAASATAAQVVSVNQGALHDRPEGALIVFRPRGGVKSRRRFWTPAFLYSVAECPTLPSPIIRLGAGPIKGRIGAAPCRSLPPSPRLWRTGR